MKDCQLFARNQLFKEIFGCPDVYFFQGSKCANDVHPHLNSGAVPLNQLIGDLTILTSNFDDQCQFLKTNFSRSIADDKKALFLFFLSMFNQNIFISTLLLKFHEKCTTHDV